MSDFIKVEQGDSRKKNINVKNIEPVNGIKIIRDHEPSISSASSDESFTESEYSEKPVKKTKKVFRKKENYKEPQHNYSAFSNPKKTRVREETESESEYGSTSEESYSDESMQSEENGRSDWEDKQKLKQDLLIKIQSLEKKNFEFSKKFNMTSNYEEMLFEYEKVKKFIDTQAGIKFARRCLMACVTGIEFLNKRFDPFNIKLEGWSENVMESVEDYDNIFERLHEKYSSKAEIAPEIELLLTLGGSAFMFHLTNSLLKGPGIGAMMSNMMGGGNKEGVVAQNNPNFMASMMGAMSQGMKEMSRPPSFKPTVQQNSFPAPMETRGIRKEMQSQNIDPGLFNNTPLATNYPSRPIQPMANPNMQFKPPQVVYYNESVNDDDDRYSIASSDSSLSSVSIGSTIKTVSVRKAAPGKKGKNVGLELNIN
jgi:hypothetical protein